MKRCVLSASLLILIAAVACERTVPLSPALAPTPTPTTINSAPVTGLVATPTISPTGITVPPPTWVATIPITVVTALPTVPITMSPVPPVYPTPTITSTVVTVPPPTWVATIPITVVTAIPTVPVTVVPGTPTPSAGCTFTYITLPNTGPQVFTISLTPGITPTPNPYCWGPGTGATPVTAFSGSLGNSVFLIQSQADWQNFYNCANPPPSPVDFSTQMIIAVEYQGCLDHVSFYNVCETNSQVTVSIQDVIPQVVCYALVNPGDIVAVVVPKSTLPITWQFNVIHL